MPPASTADAFARLRAAGFVGTATPLADLDLPQAGAGIGVGEDEIHAVIDVESAGSGFDALKRPKMLFEPHRFYEALSGARRDRAVSLGLATPIWTRAYPPDSYPRLFQAMAIDETAALESASWGLGQILGGNHGAAGYDSPQRMVLAFVEGGEGEHLAAMVLYIAAARLDGALRRHDWAAFARGYNGPKYRENGYDAKLAARYAVWARIRDTPWSPPTDAVGKAIPVPPIAATPLPAPAPAPSAVPSQAARPGLLTRLVANLQAAFPPAKG